MRICTHLGFNSDYRAGCFNCVGEEVLLSDQLLEAISLEAQLHLQLRRPPIQGNFLVDITVRAAQKALGNDQGARRQEIVPFFASLNRTMYYTLSRVAERAGLARKEPRRLITDPGFWDEFCKGALDVKMKAGKSVAKIQKSLFKVCHEIVKKRYAQSASGN